MHRFRELQVYQRALKVSKDVRQITRSFPRDEQFVLTAQFRRASDSIPLNISEGAGNDSKKEFSRFLSYSVRSGYECIGCLDIALSNEYIDETLHRRFEQEFQEIIAMLIGLRRSLEKSKPSQRNSNLTTSL